MKPESRSAESFRIRILVCSCLLCAGGTAMFAKQAGCTEPTVKLELRERWTNEFSAGRVVRSFQIQSPRELMGKLLWSLSSKQRTLARGEKVVRATVNAPHNIEVSIDIEPLKDELIIPVQFQVALVEGDVPVARHASTIWFFSREPFAPHREWLKSLHITVFDPVGKTADVLSKTQIPFTETSNRNVLSSTSGLLLIGEGITLSDFGGLADQIMRSAAQGALVVWLSPASGSLPLEFSQERPPAELLFADSRAIHRLDKRLDANAWGPTGSINGARLKFSSAQNAVNAQVVPEGWSWIDARFTDTSGRLVFCGLPIIERWDDSPTPRYLLLRVLEDLKRE